MKNVITAILIFTLTAVLSPQKVKADASNLPPVAIAGNDQIIILDGTGTASATMSGAASYDPEGLLLGEPDNGIVQWEWSGDFLASPQFGKTPTLTFVTPGIKTVTLTVMDGLGATATDSLEVTVATPGPTIAVAAQDVVVELNGDLNFLQLSNYLNNHGGAVATSPHGAVTWTNNFSGETVFVPGAYQAFETTFYAQDVLGGISATTSLFIIEDTTAPEITWDVNGTTVAGNGLVLVPKKAQPGVVVVNASDWSGASLTSLTVVRTSRKGTATVEGNTVSFDGGKKGDRFVLRAEAVDGSGLTTVATLRIEIGKERNNN